MEPILLDNDSSRDHSLAEEAKDHEDPGSEEEIEEGSKPSDSLEESDSGSEDDVEVGNILKVNADSDDSSSSDPDDFPAPVALGKPRLVAAGGAATAASSTSLYDRFYVRNLITESPPRNHRAIALPGLRDGMLDVSVMREALRVIGAPSTSLLLEGCPPKHYAKVSTRLAHTVADALLEASPQANHLVSLLLEQQLLGEVWQLMEAPAPLESAQARQFRALLDRLLRRHRVRTLEWMLTPSPSGDASAEEATSSSSSPLKAEAVRTLPVFRLLRHLESEDITAVIIHALEREVDTGDDVMMMGGGRGRGMARPAGDSGAERKQMRWSNKFDLVRVLVHKMRVKDDSPEAEDAARNAATLLSEVLKHSNSHVDLLKSMMQATPLVFDLAVAPQDAGHLNEVQFAAALSVLLDLCRCLGRIWLPNRRTRIISDTIKVFVDNLPRLAAVLTAQPLTRVTRVRLLVADLAALCLSGRLVSLFVTPLVESNVLALLLEACVTFPHCTMLHLSVFSNGLLPMLENCLCDPPPEDDVFAPAADGARLAVKELGLWDFIVENHFSYDPATESRRNRFAFNGYLTRMANTLLCSTYELPTKYTTWASTQLDWTNTLENTPLSSQVYASRYGGGESAASAGHSIGFSSSSDDDDDEHHEELPQFEDSDDDDDEQTLLNKSVEAVKPGSLKRYNTPPRPRFAPRAEEGTPEEEPPSPEQIDAAQDVTEDVVGEFNARNFWTIPVDDSMLF